MSAENNISIQIPAETLSTVKANLKECAEFLKPYLIALTPDDRQDLPKMSDKTLPFVETVYNLRDTQTLAGNEAYAAALAYYNSVKQAAKMNVPNAKTIQEELGNRFKGQGVCSQTSRTEFGNNRARVKLELIG